MAVVARASELRDVAPELADSAAAAAAAGVGCSPSAAHAASPTA
eukprot:gene52457-49935_t